MISGQVNMANPAIDATTSAMAVRGAIRSTARSVGPVAVRRRSRQGGRDLVDGEPSVGVEHLGHLRGEGRRGDHHLRGGAVGDDLALREHHHSIGGSGHELHVMGGDHDGVAGGGELAQQPGELAP